MRALAGSLCVALLASAVAAEQSWEFRGDLVALKPGDPDVAVVRLADGRSVELPLESLSPASQAAARSAAAALAVPVGDDDGVVTVRGPFGRSVRVAVPESIKQIEADAIHCRTADEAADVYRLALAGEVLTAEQRAAASLRLGEWEALSAKRLIRLGDRWVTAAESRAAAEEAAKVIGHALELMRQGSVELAEEDLKEACRIDPEDGRASFVLGLAYALVAQNPAKAADHFADVVRREPDNAAALNDLAVVEVFARRYATIVEHFRRAAAATADPRPVADNVAWAVRLAGDAKVNPALARNRMPEKIVTDLNALYRSLTQDRKIKPAEGVSGPRFVGPDGTPCTVATLADVAALFTADAAAAPPPASRQALGFVVAEGHVVCPRRVLVDPDGRLSDDVTIVPHAGWDRRVAARVVAAPDNADVALLACEGLDVAPLPLASQLPPSSEIIAVDQADEDGFFPELKTARGSMRASPVQPGKKGPEMQGRFIHTAVVSRGLGGGPILDGAGHVVGMVAATPRTDASGNTVGLGWPVERIAALVADHCDISPAAEGNGADVSTVDERATERTIVVVVTGRPDGSGGAR